MGRLSPNNGHSWHLCLSAATREFSSSGLDCGWLVTSSWVFELFFCVRSGAVIVINEGYCSFIVGRCHVPMKSLSINSIWLKGAKIATAIRSIHSTLTSCTTCVDIVV